MKLGIIGLGKMGNAIAYRVIRGGHQVVGFDLNKQALKQAEKIGVDTVSDLSDLVERADVIWLMVPVGETVDATIKNLIPHLDDGDIIVDGGNSNFKDSVRRANDLEKMDIQTKQFGDSSMSSREISLVQEEETQLVTWQPSS